MARIPLGVRVWSALVERIPAAGRWRRGALASGIGADDHETDGPHGTVRIRVFRPLAESSGRPLIVLLPGDGARASAWLPSTLARELDAVVATVRDPPGPTHPLSDRVDTGAAALRWITAHAAGWGASADRLGVVGDGPGADVVLLLAPRNRDEQGPHISRQVLISPGTDVPLPDNLRGLPTALVQVGEHDPRRDRTVVTVDALKGAGVPARVAEYPGATEGWFRYPTVHARVSGRALDDIVHFLRRGLNDENSFRVIPAWDLH